MPQPSGSLGCGSGPAPKPLPWSTERNGPAEPAFFVDEVPVESPVPAGDLGGDYLGLLPGVDVDTDHPPHPDALGTELFFVAAERGRCRWWREFSGRRVEDLHRASVRGGECAELLLQRSAVVHGAPCRFPGLRVEHGDDGGAEPGGLTLSGSFRSGSFSGGACRGGIGCLGCLRTLLTCGATGVRLPMDEVLVTVGVMCEKDAAVGVLRIEREFGGVLSAVDDRSVSSVGGEPEDSAVFLDVDRHRGREAERGEELGGLNPPRAVEPFPWGRSAGSSAVH